ncbi:MAG TPA: RNA 3'-terminal phosphate cyclase [Fimbriimonadaceae bacterium]|nr:RNA 3'-terminal phosphate cyclase [Fimbriimonadaceae bacterium]
MDDLIRIDGSHGEGGGQVLRTSLSLSAITGRAVEIANIRGGRAKPGLQAQHLAAVRAAARICGASCKGDALGSLYLLFEPKHPVRSGDYRFEIGTAGATTLVAQTLIVPLALAGGSSTVVIDGGTHNPMAPTADYLRHVYASALREMGFRFEADYGPPGFYPRGGGELKVRIEPASEIAPIVLTDRIAPNLRAHIVTSCLPESVSERAEKVFADELQIHASSRVVGGTSPGAAVTIVGNHCGFSSLGERGKRMEKVAGEAIEDARKWILGKASVDEHLADQLVLPALFARGESRWSTPSVTEHLRTVIWVAKHFLDFEAHIDEETGFVSLSPC